MSSADAEDTPASSAPGGLARDNAAAARGAALDGATTALQRRIGELEAELEKERARLAEATALLERCRSGFDWNQFDDASQNAVGRDLESFLSRAPAPAAGPDDESSDACPHCTERLRGHDPECPTLRKRAPLRPEFVALGEALGMSRATCSNGHAWVLGTCGRCGTLQPTAAVPAPAAEPTHIFATEQQAWLCLESFFDGESNNKSDEQHDAAQAAFELLAEQYPAPAAEPRLYPRGRGKSMHPELVALRARAEAADAAEAKLAAVREVVESEMRLFEQPKMALVRVWDLLRAPAPAPDPARCDDCGAALAHRGEDRLCPVCDADALADRITDYDASDAYKYPAPAPERMTLLERVRAYGERAVVEAQVAELTAESEQRPPARLIQDIAALQLRIDELENDLVRAEADSAVADAALAQSGKEIAAMVTLYEMTSSDKSAAEAKLAAVNREFALVYEQKITPEQFCNALLDLLRAPDPAGKEGGNG